MSHGQERGPIRVRHSVEVKAHRPPVRALRGITENAPTPPQPPPEDEVQKVHLWKADVDSDDKHADGSPVIDHRTVFIVGENLALIEQAPDEFWLADAAGQLGAERILTPKGHTEIVNNVEVEIVGVNFLRPIVT